MRVRNPSDFQPYKEQCFSNEGEDKSWLPPCQELLKERHCGSDRGSCAGVQWRWKDLIQERKEHPRGSKNGSTHGAGFLVGESSGRDLRKGEAMEITQATALSNR